MFKYSAFSMAVSDSLCDTALAYSLIAARWAVLGYDWYVDNFFSAKAEARYQEIGTILGMAMVVTVAAGMTARIIVEDFAGNIPAVEEDYSVDLGDDADDEPIDDYDDSWELIDDYMDDEEIFAESISHESYLDRQMELEAMTLKALVPLAADLNLVTRKVRKGVLIEAIMEAEGYEA